MSDQGQILPGTPSHEHPSNVLYVKVALVLAAFTAVEVALPYVADVEGPVIAVMLAVMVIKFAVVAGMFMHLRFDSVMFRRMFVAGLVLAVGVYLAAMLSMQFFGDEKDFEPLEERARPASITR